MITIREAAESDRARIDELFAEMMSGIYGNSETGGCEEGYLDKYLGDGNDRIFAADDGGRSVAYIAVEVHDDFIYLDDISVSEEYRGQGLGTKLIETAENYAAELGITQSALHVEIENTSAQRLYRRIGYSAGEPEGSRLRMTKKLSDERGE